MDMVTDMDGAITVDADITTAGAEVAATIMVGGIIAITGELTVLRRGRPVGGLFRVRSSKLATCPPVAWQRA
jgi:hypothetical protein